MEPLALNVTNAALALGISREQVRAMCRERAIRCARTSAGAHASWIIPRQAVDEFLGARARTSMSGRALRAEDV